MAEPWQALVQIVSSLGLLAADLVAFVLHWSLAIAWLAWWLWGVNWKKAWPVLAQGAWLPVVLLMLIVALVWSQIAPSDCSCLGFVVMANFWWQLGAVSLVVAITLLCGWLQGVFDWGPAEMAIEPPEPAHEPGLDHALVHH